MFYPSLCHFQWCVVLANCFQESFEAGKASIKLPNCQEGDYDRGVASVKLPNCQEGDYDRGVASVRLPNCQEGDYDRGLNEGFYQGLDQGRAESICLPPPPLNCQEGDYDKGVTDGKASCPADRYEEGVTAGKTSCQTCPTPISCQEGDYDRGYNEGFQAGQSSTGQGTISTAEIQQCLADASQCTGQLKAIYEAGQQSVQQSVKEDDCEANPQNCVISSLQVFYDYFMLTRGGLGQLSFPAGLEVPPLGGIYGPAYEFRQSCLERGDGTCLIQKTSGNGDIDQPLGGTESLGYIVDLVPWWNSSVKGGEMEIVFRPW